MRQERALGSRKEEKRDRLAGCLESTDDDQAFAKLASPSYLNGLALVADSEAVLG